MTSIPSFFEHLAVQPLLPYLRDYTIKGLRELRGQENGGKFKATHKESYAAQVIERVDALENCVRSLRLALNFIQDLDNDQSDATYLYQYHYENFLLRLTGIVDRAYRLVGTSLCLDPLKLDKISANPFVTKAVVTDHPDLYRLLMKLSDAVALHKTTRNSIAHSAAYTSRELGLFTAVTSMELELGEIDIRDLMRHYFSKGGVGLAHLIEEMVSCVQALLCALAPIYEAAIGGDSPDPFAIPADTTLAAE